MFLLKNIYKHNRFEEKLMNNNFASRTFLKKNKKLIQDISLYPLPTIVSFEHIIVGLDRLGFLSLRQNYFTLIFIFFVKH